MPFKCLIGLHLWDGCKCKHCNKIRNEKHNWSKDCQKCSKCGKTRTNDHDWSTNCKECANCRITRDVEHTWDGCYCVKCKKANHYWDGYICMKCEEKRSDLAFTDSRDGQVYKYVKIGNQFWMAENLRYNAGDYCCVIDNDYGNISKYGYLYNWLTAKRVSPKGWHLPSAEEWHILINFITSSHNINDEYKICRTLMATSGWLDNEGSSDDFSFSALPGGNISGNLCGNRHEFVGHKGEWWSSSKGTLYKYMAVSFHIKCKPYYEYDSPMSISETERDSCFSIRCIKD